MSHPSNRPTLETLETLFTYYAPCDATITKYSAINDAAKAFARAVLEHAPDCADRSAAIRHIREARMTANAAIATDPRP